MHGSVCSHSEALRSVGCGSDLPILAPHQRHPRSFPPKWSLTDWSREAACMSPAGPHRREPLGCEPACCSLSSALVQSALSHCRNYPETICHPSVSLVSREMDAAASRRQSGRLCTDLELCSQKSGHRKNTFLLSTDGTPAVTLERDGEGCALSFRSSVLGFHPVRLKDHAARRRSSQLRRFQSPCSQFDPCWRFSRTPSLISDSLVL